MIYVPKNKNYKVDVVSSKDGREIRVNLNVLNDNFSLFRYRSINEYTLEQFANDDFFATSPSAFNDPYDSVVYFDEALLRNHISKKLLTNLTFTDRLMKFYKIGPVSTDALVDEIYASMNPTFSFGRETCAIASLSTNVNQEIMWAHYAGLAKGFALEYAYSDLHRLCVDRQEKIRHRLEKNGFWDQKPELKADGFDLLFRVSMPLLPVFYDDMKDNITDLYESVVDYLFDEMGNGTKRNLIDGIQAIRNKRVLDVDVINQFFRKKKDWKYEREWRAFFYNLDYEKSPFLCVEKLRPKAIYLGEKISAFYKEALIDMSRKKGIDVFQMTTKIVKKRMKLVPIRIWKAAKSSDVKAR